MLLQEMKEECVAVCCFRTSTSSALYNALSGGCGLSVADVVASRCKALDVHEERRLVRLPESAIDGNSSEFSSVICDMITKTSRDEVGALLLPQILHCIVSSTT